MTDMGAIDTAKLVGELSMLEFFNQRAGRELWAEKPTAVQNADITNAERILNTAASAITTMRCTIMSQAEQIRQAKALILKVYADLVAMGNGAEPCIVCSNNTLDENCWDVKCGECPKATLCKCSNCSIKDSNFVSQYMDEVIRMTKEGEK